MSKDNNIKNFTAADIEKYHKGLLSAKERHDLEKAALDDPFLADALEGYADAGVNLLSDINDLENRLGERVEKGKVIVMKGAGKSSFPWLRVAALVIIIAGAGLMAKQFIFTDKSKNEIASAGQKKPEEIKPGGNTTSGSIAVKTDSLKISSGTVSVPLKQNEQRFTFIATDSIAGPADSKVASGSGDITTGNFPVTSNTNPPVAAVPVKAAGEKPKQAEALDEITGKKEIARDVAKNKTENSIKPGKYSDKDTIKGLVAPTKDDGQINNAVADNRKARENQNYRNQAVNSFRGRVTDSSNVGVPFANVTNAQDNHAGTYTDAKGYFNLTHPDSVLSVQVRSVGFENVNVQLRNDVANNQVILQDDRSLAAQTIPASKKINTEERSKMANVKLEEPEPADGWEKYDAYLTNNLNVPEEIKTRQNSTGEVQVSFEVDKNGEPVKIKIEKSLCSKCDQEAIRLIKEGPRFKRKAKKGRTTVIIPFNNSL